MSDEASSCLQCGYESTSAEAQCPQCEGRMFSASAARRRGWVLIIAGLFLVILAGVMIIREAVNVYHAGEPDAKVRYTGGTGMIVLMFGFLGLILSFGVGFTANGIWQILYGKQNRNLKAIVFALWSLFMTTALIVEFFLWMSR